MATQSEINAFEGFKFKIGDVVQLITDKADGEVWCGMARTLAASGANIAHGRREEAMSVIRVRDYKGPVVAATCEKCGNDNLKPFGGPALNFCSHCGVPFPRIFNNPLQQPQSHATNGKAGK